MGILEDIIERRDTIDTDHQNDAVDMTTLFDMMIYMHAAIKMGFVEMRLSGEVVHGKIDAAEMSLRVISGLLQFHYQLEKYDHAYKYRCMD